jgi:hypothetical protein
VVDRADVQRGVRVERLGDDFGLRGHGLLLHILLLAWRAKLLQAPCFPLLL